MFKIPSLKPRGKKGSSKPKPAVSRGRSQAKWGPEGKPARAREQLADRATRTPPHRQGIRQTALDNRPAEPGRNYPVRGNVRRQGASRGTRAQLGERQSQRAAQGHAATAPHRTSGDNARMDYKAAGRAKRPASAMPGDATPPRTPSQKRAASAPAAIGRPPRDFARLFFGGNNSPLGRPAT